MISWEILMFSWDFLTFSWYHQNITKAGDWSNSSIGRYSIANICIIILTHTIPSKNESNFMGSTNIFDIVCIPWMNFIFSVGFPQQHTILTTIDHSFWMSNSSRSNFQGLDEPLILTACQARVELMHGHITILTTTRTLIICLWKLYTNTMWSQRPPPFNAKLRSREIWINPSCSSYYWKWFGKGEKFGSALHNNNNSSGIAVDQ